MIHVWHLFYQQVAAGRHALAAVGSFIRSMLLPGQVHPDGALVTEGARLERQATETTRTRACGSPLRSLECGDRHSSVEAPGQRRGLLRLTNQPR
jgi:hypothetical protein